MGSKRSRRSRWIKADPPCHWTRPPQHATRARVGSRDDALRRPLIRATNARPPLRWQLSARPRPEAVVRAAVVNARTVRLHVLVGTQRLLGKRDLLLLHRAAREEGL